MVNSEMVFAGIAAEAAVRLFTVTVHDLDAGLARRAFTSHPAEYPVSGTKPLTLDDDWSRQVIVGRKTFVANTTEGFRQLFPDHALITALGCASVANIPVMDADGGVAGTVNLLDVEGYFTPARVAALEALVERHRIDLLAAMKSVAF